MDAGVVSTAAPVLAAQSWASNAHLIEDVASLWLDRDALTLDPTFGKGTWWKRWCPRGLVFHDLKLDGVDFRDLPYPCRTFDQIAFDPPYVSVGGRKTTTIPEHHARYGIDEAPTTPAGVQHLIDEGLCEMQRVIAASGVLLVKCQDYISSGKLWPGVWHTTRTAFELGFTLLDEFLFLNNGSAQPGGRRQVHARRNVSHLLVFGGPK